MTRPALDWGDSVEVSLWLGGLRLSLNDLDAAAGDMLRPPRERELGPALHERNYSEAWKQVVTAIEYATAPEPEPGDPAGNGGAGPTH